MRRSTADELAAFQAADEARQAAEDAALEAERELDQRRRSTQPPTDPEVIRVRLKSARGEQLTFEEQRLFEDDAINSMTELAERTPEEREIERRAAEAAAAIRRRQRYQRN